MSFNNNANTFLPPSPVIPGNLLITGITQSNFMQVTFTNTFENTYVIGQLMFLIIPPSYGMPQANGLTGQIVDINGNTFTLNINSSFFDPFVYPPVGQFVPASMSPAGSRNLEFNNFTTFVPFQALNGTIGN